MKTYLRVLHGPKEGHTVAVTGPEFLIGRDRCCQLRPGSSSVSRRHCTIRTNGNLVSIEDHGSQNGTFVNGRRVSDSLLKSGDCIRVGRLEFEVYFTDSKEVRAATPELPQTLGESRFDDAAVLDWLEEPNEIDSSLKQSDVETRVFRFDDTAEHQANGPESSEQESGESSNGKSSRDHHASKQPRNVFRSIRLNSKDSTTAAKEMLQRFFRQN